MQSLYVVYENISVLNFAGTETWQYIFPKYLQPENLQIVWYQRLANKTVEKWRHKFWRKTGKVNI